MITRIEEAIEYALLDYVNLTTLVSTRIYPSELPQKCPLPAVVYERASTISHSAMGQDTGTYESIWRLSCHASTFTAARNVCDQVRQALQRWRGTYDYIEIKDSFLEGESTEYLNDVDVHEVIQEFKIWYYSTPGAGVTGPTGAPIQYRLKSEDHTHQSTGLQAGKLDHGLALDGLGDDDHSIYALLAGRAGGQTLIGGSAVTDILKLQGTSGNGTLTSPAIQGLVGNAGGTIAFTVLNNGNVGIGTTTPGAALAVSNATAPQMIISDGTNSHAIYINSNGYLAISRKNNYSAAAVLIGEGNDELYIRSTSGGGIKISDASNIGNIAEVGNNPLTFGTNGVERMRIQPTTGNVGIGTVAPAHALAVNCPADNDVIVDLESEDAVEGTISVAGAAVSYNAFCGSHYTQLKDGQVEPPVGAVVVSLGEIIPCEVTVYKDEVTSEEIKKEDAFETVVTEIIGEKIEQKYILNGEDAVLTEITTPPMEGKTERRLKAGVTLDEKTGIFSQSTTTKVPVSKDVSKKEYFTYVDTTSKPGDKRVYGTWFGKMTDDSHGQSFGQNDKAVYLVAQVGLFKIRVTDTNGNIENGDYLETSSRPMEAQKQSGDARINSTIAKAIIDVDWKTVEVDRELGYKWKLIPCTF